MRVNTSQLQKAIQNLLDEMVSQGRERGVQAAAYFRGELVVNAFAGVANYETAEPVTSETLFPVFSTTKGVVATVIHRLAERGSLDYDAPITAYWPEFGAHGKTGITVRHALNHTSGIPYMPLGVGLSQICDWDFMCDAIADLEPASAPGERVEYHAVTFGWILGELARRVDGRSFPELMKQEICAPLGIQTMFCGLPAELESSVAVLEEPNAAPMEVLAEPTPQAIPSWITPLAQWMNRSDARRACIPASNGIMTADAVARHYAALLPGGVDGVELLPPARVEVACAREQVGTGEEVSGRGLGYQVGVLPSTPAAFGHGGYGGSLGFADPESGWAFGFTRNRFSDVNSAQIIWEEIRRLSLGRNL
jgi:CubicO group peptidase (beta-lactamase class C family)